MLTTQDWLGRIGGANLDECLDGAERAAASADDWNAIAAACAAHDRASEARRGLDRAIAIANGDHWPSRRAAEQLLALGDPVAARAAIAAIETQLGAWSQIYQWVLLARAYREVLGDEDAVARCLASAEVATDGDLADLAAGRVELAGDRAGAIALLERAEAEAYARGKHRQLWSVANRWYDPIGDEARARAVLTAAIARAPDLAAVVWIPAAWAGLFPDDDDGIAAAMARGDALATTAADWLELAEAYRDGGDGNRELPWNADAVRRCLDAANAADPDDGQRARIAIGFRRWLGDDARAAAVTPPEPTPAVHRTLVGWPADGRALFDRLRERLTPSMLDQMANADYGIDFRKHRAALAELQATGQVEAPMPWQPHEALALTRWSDGAGCDHVTRAFACTALVIEMMSPRSYRNDLVDGMVPQLVESAWSLDLVDELHGFLAWVAEVAGDPDGAPDATIAILALLVSAARRRGDDARLPALIDALETAAYVPGAPDQLAGALRDCIMRKTWGAQVELALAALAAPLRARLSALVQG